MPTIVDGSNSLAWQHVQSALLHAQHGEVVRLGAGHYAGAGSLCPPAGVSLEGEAGVLLCRSDPGPAIEVLHDDVRLAGLRLVAGSADQVLLQIGACAGARVEHCTFDGAGLAHAAIVVELAEAVSISHCRIEACSDAEMPGGACVLFYSSIGEVIDCDVVGGSLGIVAQRCELAADLPSHLKVARSRISASRSYALGFFSSQGTAEDNECWGSRKGGGIVAQRDPNSPTEPSEVSLRGNRCHDNEEAGIGFFSSRGTAEDNECWGSRKGGGIGAQRDPDSPTEPSEVILRGNRCHGNEQSGIVFSSSHGIAEDNECWGNRQGSGIAAHRDPDSPTEPSDVVLRGNRCYDNAAGIIFASSIGTAECNDCWGSRVASGIAMHRDPKSPTEPSAVVVRGNRCHDNQEAGILYSSSVGQVEDNACWGSRTRSGIVVQRESATPTEQAQVDVRRNRCSDNAQSGILFLSSHGTAEDNACWGNLNNGIGVERALASPTDPSAVTVSRNCCHGNQESGIAFADSHGTAKDNECWGNQHNHVVGLRADQVTSHRTEPTSHPDVAEQAWLGRHPMGAWVQHSTIAKALATAQCLALADFVFSGSCPDCFKRFWLGGGQSFRASEALPADDERLVPHSYQLQRPVQGGGVKVRRLERAALSGLSAPAPGLPVLDSLLVRMGKRRWRTRGKAQGSLEVKWLTWPRRLAAGSESQVVGLVSANEAALDAWLADEPRLQQLLNKSKTGGRNGARPWWRRDWRLRLRVFDLRTPAVQAGGEFLGRQLLSERSRMQRWGGGLRALAQAPLSAVLTSLAVAMLGWLLVLFGLLGFDGLTRLDRLEGWQAAWGALQDKGMATWGGLVDESKVGGAALAVLCVVAFVVVPVTRLLPVELGGVGDRWLRILDVWLEERAYMEFVKPLRRSRAATALLANLRRWLHSSACRRAWLRRELFGEPLFATWRPRTRPAALLMVRNVDVLDAGQVADLRSMLDLCPPGQATLLVTQMAGLSMVLGGFVDVWLPPEANPDRTANLLHDPASLEITPHLLGAETTSRMEPLGSLAALLGWPSPSRQGQGARDDWVPIANALEGPRPVPRDWLLMLVLGSMPQTHLMLRRPHVSPEDPDVAAQWQRYLFALPKQQAWSPPLGEWLRELDMEVDRASALLRVVENRRQAVWVGRVGARLELARALRDQLAGEPDLARRYLAGSLAGAERRHLEEAEAQLLTDGPGPLARTSVARGLLHLEAALALAHERNALTSMPEADRLLASLWADAASRIKAQGTMTDGLSALRLWGSLLCAEQRYEQALPQGAVLRQAAIKDGLDAHRPQGEGAWGGFTALLWILPRRLAALDGVIAHETLDALFRRDWLPLAPCLHGLVKERLAHWHAQSWQSLVAAKDADALQDACISLAGRPALVAGLLARMSAVDLRHRVKRGTGSASPNELMRRFEALADATVALRLAVGEARGCEALPAWYPSPHEPVASAATELLMDPVRRATLAAALAGGGRLLAKVSRLVDEGIDAIALGTHEQLHALLHLGQGAEYFTLGELPAMH